MTEDIDEIYRRASALDSSRPSEALRRKVLEHAAGLVTEPQRRAAHRVRWRPAIFGTLAAAALAGLLIAPRVFDPHPPAKSVETAAPAEVPPVAATAPPASAPSGAGAPSRKPAPTPPHISGLAAAAKSRAADATNLGTSGLETERAGEGMETPPTAKQTAPFPTDWSAALRRAAETGDTPTLRATLGKVSIDARDARGRTALMLAVLRGRPESVDVLLAHGANPNAADENGSTPLQAALAADRPTIAAALRRAGAR